MNLEHVSNSDLLCEVVRRTIAGGETSPARSSHRQRPCYAIRFASAVAIQCAVAPTKRLSRLRIQQPQIAAFERAHSLGHLKKLRANRDHISTGTPYSCGSFSASPTTFSRCCTTISASSPIDMLGMTWPRCRVGMGTTAPLRSFTGTSREGPAVILKRNGGLLGPCGNFARALPGERTYGASPLSNSSFGAPNPILESIPCSSEFRA